MNFTGPLVAGAVRSAENITAKVRYLNVDLADGSRGALQLADGDTSICLTAVFSRRHSILFRD